VLRLTDRADYALADVPARDVPTATRPGRGLVLGEGPTRTFHEVQIALLSGDPDGRAQQQALRDSIEAAVRRHSVGEHGQQPLRVDTLPTTVTVEDVLALGPVAAEASGAWALVGVGGDELRPVGVDLVGEGPGLLVAGPPRSGRTTALSVMTRSLLRAGRRVCLVAPPSSALRQLAGLPGVLGCLDVEATDDEAAALLALEAGADVIVVDDAERFTDSPAGALLESRLRSGHRPYVLAAGNSEDLQSTYRGFTLEVRRSRCGLLLSPQSTLDGDLVGARLSRTASSTRLPGRGLLAVHGELTPVQVALPGPLLAPAEHR
jgi:S-DNA-T family DNA segregation ATPase FtsK/SpoIIIE